MPFTKEQLQGFEKKLTAIQTEIDAQLAQMKQMADFGDDVDHGDEESDESEEFANTLGVKQLLNDRKQAAFAALAKIKDGTYGLCAHCGAQIDETVLAAVPESQLCKMCKQSS